MVPMGALPRLLFLLSIGLTFCDQARGDVSFEFKLCRLDLTSPLVTWNSHSALPLASLHFGDSTANPSLKFTASDTVTSLSLPIGSWSALTQQWTKLSVQIDSTSSLVHISVHHLNAKPATTNVELPSALWTKLKASSANLGPDLCVRGAAGIDPTTISACPCDEDRHDLRFTPPILSRQKRDTTDPCTPNPCQHSKACSPNATATGGYECDCSTSVTVSNGTTVKTLKPLGGSTTTKTFRTGWKGKNCTTDINECTEYTPCFHNGHCTNYDGHFECACRRYNGYSYTGDNCEKLIDQCGQAQPKFNVSKAPNSPGGDPVCVRGNCSTAQKILPTDPPFKCDCPPGYSGIRCEIDINECASNPCKNGAKCNDLIAAYNCTCLPGFNGTNCENNIDDCAGEPCRNNGTCIDKVNAYECNCTNTGFNGSTCENNIDECASNPCQNNATCVDGIRDFTCNCHPGYSGKTCNVDFDDCAQKPCQYNGTCLARSDKSLYGNPKYNTISPFNGNFNYTQASGHVCICLTGTRGANCSENINDCASNPCQNGTCRDLINDYRCECINGFTGRNCSENINDCSPNPCKNNAACVDGVANYTCRCAAMNSNGIVYGGRNCSVELRACRNNQCKNGATCQPIALNEASHYRCLCVAGYDGTHCTKDTRLGFNTTTALVTINATAIRNLSFFFQTTLRNAVLLSIAAENFVVSLIEQRVSVNGAPPLSTSPWPTAPCLNCNPWTEVAIVDAQTLRIGQTSVALAPYLKAAKQNNLGIGNVTIGNGFLGCVRNLKGNAGELLYSSGVTTPLVTTRDTGSCQRTPQCTANTCNNTGTTRCLDMWNSFKCDCKLGYTGTRCENALIPLTFGINNTVSYVAYLATDAMKKYYTNGFGFKFSIKLMTLVSNDTTVDTLLAYYRIGVSTAPMGYILILFTPKGELKVALMHQKAGSAEVGSPQTFSGLPITDGQAREFSITLSETSPPKLGVTLAGFPSKEVNVNDIFKPSTFLADLTEIYIGGYAGAKPPLFSYSIPKRVKRATAPLPAYITGTARSGLLGGIYDARSEPVRMEMSTTTGTSTGDVLKPDTSVKTTAGAITEDVCGKMKPCQNGGNCTNVYLNTFRCTCKSGWRGLQCEFKDFCLPGNTRCPSGYTCTNVPDQNFFECAGSISFTANSPAISFTPTGESSGLKLSIISLRLRTRTKTALGLLAIYNAAGTLLGNVTMLADGRVQGIRGGGSSQVISTFTVNTGAWVMFTVDYRNNRVTLTTTTEANRYQVVAGTDTGLVSVTRVDLIADKKLKGCVSSVRVNGYPFALHPKSSTNAEQGGPPKWRPTLDAALTSRLMTNKGKCASDPVCNPNPCKNSGKCWDQWNAYKCNCTSEFSGTDCSNAVCVGSTASVVHSACLNGGSCQVGANPFNCSCAKGFIGYRCAASDPCASSPCKNGASCKAEIKVDGNSSVASKVEPKCTCTGGWSGSRCDQGLKMSSVNYAVIFGVIGALLLILLIVLIVLVVRHVRIKRATRGVYDPHSQEINGSHVYMSNVIKPPPGERLI